MTSLHADDEGGKGCFGCGTTKGVCRDPNRHGIR
ncbi:hypothetical protein ACVWXU_006601 [Streptomyces sp. TE33382]